MSLCIGRNSKTSKQYDGRTVIVGDDSKVNNPEYTRRVENMSYYGKEKCYDYVNLHASLIAKNILLNQQQVLENNFTNELIEQLIARKLIQCHKLLSFFDTMKKNVLYRLSLIPSMCDSTELANNILKCPPWLIGSTGIMVSEGKHQLDQFFKLSDAEVWLQQLSNSISEIKESIEIKVEQLNYTKRYYKNKELIKHKISCFVKNVILIPVERNMEVKIKDIYKVSIFNPISENKKKLRKNKQQYNVYCRHGSDQFASEIKLLISPLGMGELSIIIRRYLISLTLIKLKWIGEQYSESGVKDNTPLSRLLAMERSEEVVVEGLKEVSIDDIQFDWCQEMDMVNPFQKREVPMFSDTKMDGLSQSIMRGHDSFDLRKLFM